MRRARLIGLLWASLTVLGACRAPEQQPAASGPGPQPSVPKEQSSQRAPAAGGTAPSPSNATPSVVDLEAASSDSWSDASVGSRVFEPQRVDDVRVAMGTQVRLAAYTTQSLGRGQIKKAFDAAYEELDRLEQLLSGWRDDSDVGRINQGAGEWIPVAKETAFVVSSSLQTSRLSHGVFDISFNVFADVWRFGDRKEKVPVLPTPAAVQEALKHVDYRRVGVHDDPPRVRIEKGMQISLGGIAKGYIVDQLRRELQRRGLTSFLVQAGGDLLGVGKKPDGTAWRSGVRDPRGGPDDWFAVIDLTDHAFSTAGDYARAFIVDGRRYHHIIDPRTGYPAEASRSVTIWARDALTADAIDDAVFILGPGEGLKLVESLPGVGALIVDKDNKVWVSRRLQGRVELVSQPSPGI